MPERIRLDLALEQRGLVQSRARARDAILRGTVTVNGAPASKPRGEMPPGKKRARRACPAGLGALAITVSPPPTTAPSTTAILRASPRLGTSVAR